MGRVRVHILYEHAADLKPYGSSYIRLLLPLRHNSNQPFLEVTHGLEYKPADVLIIDRLWRPDVSTCLVRDLIKRARRDGVKIVYSIDDNLLDLEPDPPLRVWPQEEHKLVATYLARQANMILVSTEKLRRRFDRLNQRIVVLPNAIDERLFFPSTDKASRTRQDFLTIGYMGTPSHDDDLLMIVQPLRALLRKSVEGAEATRLVFEIVGGLLDKSLLRLFEGLPVRLLRVPDADIEYPRFIAWMKQNVDWDLAIAPLFEDEFTECKSDMKFLDYAGLRTPGLYSRVSAYRDSVVHLETGLLVENRADNWAGALEQMIEDDQLRRKIARSAASYVARERTLEVCAHRWREALLGL